MPQLDPFTYFSQFLWFCLLFFTFYIFICNNGYGFLSISRILKLRNQLLAQPENKILSKKANSQILQKAFSTSVSYMQSTNSEVSEWSKALHFSKKIPLLASFGELRLARRLEENLCHLISKSSTNHPTSTCKNERMQLHLLHALMEMNTSPIRTFVLESTHSKMKPRK